jgi:hypothetical protein
VRCERHRSQPSHVANRVVLAGPDPGTRRAVVLGPSGYCPITVIAKVCDVRMRVLARTLSPARKGLIVAVAAYLAVLLGLVLTGEGTRAAQWVVAGGFAVLAGGLPWMLVALCADYVVNPAAWRRTVVVEGVAASESYTVPPHPSDESFVLHRVYEFTTLHGETRRAVSRARFRESPDGRVGIRYDPRHPTDIWPARVAFSTAAAGTVLAALTLTAAVFALGGAVGFGMATFS